MTGGVHYKLKTRLRLFFASYFIFLSIALFAQGEGGAAESLGAFESGGNITIGGDISASFTGFFEDFSDIKNINSGALLKMHLSLLARGEAAEAFIKLKFAPRFFNGDIIPDFGIDEAYTSVFFKPVHISLGLKKISWGKADSEGPLDVINPIDYSDLSEIGDWHSLKTASPMVHAALSLGAYSKLEAVFIPWFSAHKFARRGSVNERWTPRIIRELENNLANMAALEIINPAAINEADTQKLKYFQAGARWTSTIRGFDIGAQYYYGLLPRPAFSIDIPAAVPPLSVSIDTVYNRFHLAGVDAAAAIAGFNLRGEAALNITDDIKGDDPAVYNPAVLWSLGFDKSFFGFNLNVQLNEKIRLFNDRTGKQFPLPPSGGVLELDVEGGKSVTFTRLSAELSYGFFNDRLRLKMTALWDIEDKDAVLLPSVRYLLGEAEFALSSGFFVGNASGELGQYKNNNFIKAQIKYSF